MSDLENKAETSNALAANSQSSQAPNSDQTTRTWPDRVKSASRRRSLLRTVRDDLDKVMGWGTAGLAQIDELADYVDELEVRAMRAPAFVRSAVAHGVRLDCVKEGQEFAAAAKSIVEPLTSAQIGALIAAASEEMAERMTRETGQKINGVQVLQALGQKLGELYQTILEEVR